MDIWTGRYVVFIILKYMSEPLQFSDEVSGKAYWRLENTYYLRKQKPYMGSMEYIPEPRPPTVLPSFDIEKETWGVYINIFI